MGKTEFLLGSSSETYLATDSLPYAAGDEVINYDPTYGRQVLKFCLNSGASASVAGSVALIDNSNTPIVPSSVEVSGGNASKLAIGFFVTIVAAASYGWVVIKGKCLGLNSSGSNITNVGAALQSDAAGGMQETASGVGNFAINCAAIVNGATGVCYVHNGEMQLV